MRGSLARRNAARKRLRATIEGFFVAISDGCWTQGGPVFGRGYIPYAAMARASPRWG